MADPIATAADYADAMMTARRAKNALFLLLFLLLLLQLTIFLLVRFDVIELEGATTIATTSSAGAEQITPGTGPATVEAVEAAPADPDQPAKLHPLDLLRYLITLSDFLGMAIVIVLALVLLLIVNIMLVGRLIGVGRLTSAYIWTIVLAVLLFPWQAVLEAYAFPGVLYTWDELVRFAEFPNRPLEMVVLRWARFVVLPLVAAIILLSIQVKSRRGIRQALGEGGVDLAAPPIA